MKLLTLSCNECGAPLEVPEGTKYVTCGYCSARLAVQRTTSAVYTEVIEKIGQQTEKLAQDLEILKLQNELAQLDRQWMEEREDYMVRGKHGKRLPNAGVSIFAAAMMAVGGLIFMGTAASSGAPGAALLGFLLIGVALFLGIASVTKANAYAEAHDRYEQRRLDLIARIRAQESAAVGHDGVQAESDWETGSPWRQEDWVARRSTER